jgi:hypothetical protein
MLQFPSSRAAERASFNEVQRGMLDYVLAWSMQDAKKEEAERVRPLGFVVNLEDDGDEAGPSQRCDDDGQGWSSWAAKVESASDDDDGGGANYDVFYQHLGMQ